MGLDFWLYPKGELTKSFVEISGYSNKEICEIIEENSHDIESIDILYYSKNDLIRAIICLMKLEKNAYAIEIAQDIEKGISQYTDTQIFESYCSM